MVMKREMTVGNDENAPASTASGGGSESKYRGVRKRKWGKYVSEIRLPNSRERIWLGSYDSAEKAARAFDAATFCLRGRSAKFNFPDSRPEIPGARSLSRPEIQEVAARFAEDPTRTQENPTRHDQSEVVSHCLSESMTSVSAFSEGTVHSDFLSDGSGGSYFDMLTTMGSSDYATDYGVFPTYDEFYSPELAFPGEDSVDGALTQESIFLWNF